MSGYSGDDPAAATGAPQLFKDWKAGDTTVGFRGTQNARFPRLPPVQRASVKTLSTAAGGVAVGRAKWIYPNPYPAGMLPVLGAVIVSATQGLQIAIVEKTEAYAVIEVTRMVPGLNLAGVVINLGTQAVGGVDVDLTANIPTPTVTT